MTGSNLPLMYLEYSVLLEKFQNQIAENHMPTMNDMRVLRELSRQHGLLGKILILRKEIADLMTQGRVFELIEAKILEMEGLVEQL